MYDFTQVSFVIATKSECPREVYKLKFQEYEGFGSVSPFWIRRDNICVWVDSIQSGIN